MSNDNTNNGNGSVLGKVLTGAAVVGAAVVAAKVVSDHKEEIQDKLEEVKEKGSEMVEQIKGDTVEAVNQAFEDLRKQIEDSPKAQDFNSKLTYIADGLKRIKESNQDDVTSLVEKIKSQIQDLKNDFETQQK